MNLERQTTPVEVFSTTFCDELDVDELMAIIKNAKEVHGAEYVELYDETTYSCGDSEHEAYHLEFYKRQPESDAAYKSRIEREERSEFLKKQQRIANIEKARKAEVVKVAKEKTQLKTLMDKYPELIKK